MTTNAQVKADIAAKIQDNTSRLITPAVMRDVLTEMVDYSSTATSSGVGSSANVFPCSTVIPFDDSIPQITEGEQVVGVTFTPQLDTSMVEVSYAVMGSVSKGMYVASAVFQDNASNALTGSLGLAMATGPNQKFCIQGTFQISAATATARTYNLRVGPSQTGTVYVNGDSSGNRLFGGACTAVITAREVFQ